MTNNYSLEEIRDKIRAAVNKKYNNDPMKPADLWPQHIKPSTPIIEGTTILEDYRNDKFYEIPFRFENDEITLGESTEVQRHEIFTAVKADDLFVFKDEAQRVVTSPVLVPYCDDCDAKRGEKQLTPDDIQSMMYEYMINHRIVDKYHDYLQTGEDVADPVEVWQLREPVVTKNIAGQYVSLPKGTWMQSNKVNDDETWGKIEDGTLKGSSVSALSKETADQLASMKSISEKERVLIKDLKNPVGYTVSLVPNPCVEQAIFTSVKSCQASDKAGRSISNATLTKISKAYETAKNGLDNLKSLLDIAKGERIENPKTLEVEKMDKSEVEQMVDQKVNEATKDLKKENKALKEENKTIKDKIESFEAKENAIKCSKCEHELEETAKFCPECGDKIEAEKTEPDELKSIKSEVDKLKEHVNKSNDLSGEPSGETVGKFKPVNKRDLNGIPLEKNW